MALPVSTSGPLLVVLMRQLRMLGRLAPVLQGATMHEELPHLWDRTTFVNRAWVGIKAMITFSGQMVMPCGMDKGVAPLAPAAPSTHHHGSMYNCPMPQLIALKSELVLAISDAMKIYYSNL